jgi:hypothetical protein
VVESELKAPSEVTDSIRFAHVPAGYVEGMYDFYTPQKPVQVMRVLQSVCYDMRGLVETSVEGTSLKSTFKIGESTVVMRFEVMVSDASLEGEGNDATLVQIQRRGGDPIAFGHTFRDLMDRMEESLDDTIMEGDEDEEEEEEEEEEDLHAHDEILDPDALMDGEPVLRRPRSDSTGSRSLSQCTMRNSRLFLSESLLSDSPPGMI